MSVVVYAETSEGNFKNTALEAVSYGMPRIQLNCPSMEPIKSSK
jgi:hypothetical protein